METEITTRNKKLENNKIWYKAHPNYKKGWRDKMKLINPQRWKDWNRNSKLKSAYGLTIIEFNTMLASQGDSCAVCGGVAGGRGNFHVDHNHKTGKIRGLLCHNCNITLGLVKDNKEHLIKLISYLENY